MTEGKFQKYEQFHQQWFLNHIFVLDWDVALLNCTTFKLYNCTTIHYVRNHKGKFHICPYCSSFQEMLFSWDLMLILLKCQVNRSCSTVRLKDDLKWKIMNNTFNLVKSMEWQMCVSCFQLEFNVLYGVSASPLFFFPECHWKSI